MKKMMQILLFLGLGLLNSQAMAGLVVIVNLNSKITSVNVDDLKSLYLGKISSLEDVKMEAAYNRSEKLIESFSELVLGKTFKQYYSYWAVRVFTGKGTPPKNLENDNEVKDWIRNHENFIGFIEQSSLDATVKSVLSIGTSS